MTNDAVLDDPKEISTVVPRPVVVAIVLVLLALLVLDVGGQFLPGSTHEASPVLDGALLAILGSVVAASRGPKPSEPTEAPEPDSPPAAARRRHAAEEGP